ncbi:putative oxidoreductase YkvO [Cytospora mali]|uniref:Oxidoreductase YkvO n=1 Tax=Cytospora mali TaxID=578113 RepID=A0A194V6V7_CYTMA|nr:putative oxidoreductase YkvO [Valsa mali var. pyri (nom. inval.)]
MPEFLIKDEELTGLKGKVVVLTGGSSGIGLATVQLLLSLGAFVVNGDVAPTAEPQAAGYTWVKTNVANWADLNALFKEAKKIHGRIDHIFANAGLGPRADYFSMEVDENGDLKEPTYDLIDVSMKGVMNTVTLALYYMRQQAEGGSIVVNGSTMGIQRCRAVDYATAKHAVTGFARGLHPILVDMKLPIRINTLAPTWTETAVLPGLKETMAKIGVEVQSATSVARAAVMLMANTDRKGELIHVQRGKYQEIDEAILLPAVDGIRKDYPAEDDVLRRALAAMAEAAQS